MFLRSNTNLLIHIKIVAIPSRQHENRMITSGFKSFGIIMMRNLISELLTRLAEKEEESKEFVAQIEALEIVVTAILHRMGHQDQQAITCSIEDSLANVKPSDTVTSYDTDLLKKYLIRLLNRPSV